MLGLEALAEHARMGDSFTLQKKFDEAQSLITSPVTISMLIEYGLWNYNFLEGGDREKFPKIATTFRELYFNVFVLRFSSKSTWERKVRGSSQMSVKERSNPYKVFL